MRARKAFCPGSGYYKLPHTRGAGLLAVLGRHNRTILPMLVSTSPSISSSGKSAGRIFRNSSLRNWAPSRMFSQMIKSTGRCPMRRKRSSSPLAIEGTMDASTFLPTADPGSRRPPLPRRFSLCPWRQPPGRSDRPFFAPVVPDLDFIRAPFVERADDAQSISIKRLHSPPVRRAADEGTPMFPAPNWTSFSC